MSWLRVIAVWLLLMVAESISGTLRELFLVPVLGGVLSRQAGVLVGSALIFAITCGCIRWMRAQTEFDQLSAGLVWVILTIAFEFTLGAILGLTRERMMADYDLSRGGFMGFGLVFMFFVPMLAAKVRGYR